MSNFVSNVNCLNDFFSREIASSIKMLLDAFNKVIEELPFGDSGSKQV
jgi:hypothetical protein